AALDSIDRIRSSYASSTERSNQGELFSMSMTTASSSMVYRSFSKVLIANRGEIAVRIIRAAQDEGLEAVAIYANPDRDAMHVRLADHAFSLNGETVADTYLAMDKVLKAAKDSGADAVHPGYGFMAENADFAQAVIDAGMVWIGRSEERR